MNGLSTAGFSDYFHALHGHSPYPWQERLSECALAGDWPGAIDLPTGSGKTACIDIAIFALACQASLPVAERTAPRRIFFCVNRRVIVDEAHSRARRIARAIWEAEQDDAKGNAVLREVAEALRVVATTTAEHETPPLDVLELRGGIYRDNRWARSIVQPAVICTTLDQLGSRLLFRGYGVSTNAAPIQAALIAYDSLILLDEAHISEPFRQTLENVHSYLDPKKWAEESVGSHPVTVVPMTATPTDQMRKRGVIQLDAKDRKNKPLLARLVTSKPAKLAETKDVATEIIRITQSLKREEPMAVGIIVNRIATAKAVYTQLRNKYPDATIELVIGSMRPIDRDAQAERLRKLVGPERPAVTEKACFVVATQCLEVGADYDFDQLITECASLDALRQRFGRLNRAGRSIDATATILVNKKDIKSEGKLDDEKPLDPIYGNALARTWNWINEHAAGGVVDFGIDAFAALLKTHGDHGQPPQNLLAPSALLNAPVMLPAYIDLWCQTAPKPVPDPDVSLFIHGTQRGEPDVQVCWRADLIEDDRMDRDQWCDVVALLPPTSAECMSVPISRVRRWLADQMDQAQDHGDVLGAGESNDDKKKNSQQRPESLQHPGVLWRGTSDTELIVSPDDLRPGDTLILPVSSSGSDLLGHLPEAPDINDVAEHAFTCARDLAVLRLHPALRSHLPAGSAMSDLFMAATRTDEPPTRQEWSAMLGIAAEAIPDDRHSLKESVRHLTDCGVRIEIYPDQRGVVLTGRRRLGASTDWFVPSMDEGDDLASRTRRDTEISLTDHTDHVCKTVQASLAALPLDGFDGSIELAADLHDLGKADERFQAMLRRTDRTDAWLLVGVTSEPLAKSAALPSTPAQRSAARERAGLPAGFRHEMLSVQLAALSQRLPDDTGQRELILHLIASHHGHARPFAPVVVDSELPAVEVDGIALTHEQRTDLITPHRLDSGIADRFWALTRRFGWWGLAYLEATLRLADQQASAAEDQGKYDNEQVNAPAEATP